MHLSFRRKTPTPASTHRNTIGARLVEAFTVINTNCTAAQKAIPAT